jgi:EAL domain-containing protein (putative c-di-GMP-specific phosphodiesterase class I)
VAEGVETTSQLDMLREFSCDEYQGFLFSRPLDATAATALLTTACAPPQER